jgi:hypothetical protein
MRASSSSPSSLPSVRTRSRARCREEKFELSHPTDSIDSNEDTTEDGVLQMLAESAIGGNIGDCKPGEDIDMTCQGSVVTQSPQIRDLDGRSVRSTLEDTTAHLLWARLHELEALKGRVDELSTLLERADALRAEIKKNVDDDLRKTLQLAEVCLAGRVEVQHRASFSEMFAHLVAHLYTKF